MTDEFLVVARFVLLALIYLTLLAVASALWAGLRAERPVVATPAGGSRRRATAPESAAGPPAAPARPMLVQLAGHNSDAGSGAVALTFVLTADTVIGRDPDCRIRLNDPLVSKLHARICPQGSGWAVEDLGSTNGTLLNDSAVGGFAPLADRDRLQVGDTVLQVVLETP